MIKFAITDIPKQANKEKIWQKTALLSRSGIFKNTSVISLKYLGGCSNHALTTVEGRPFLIRLPGSQSNLIVDRHAEKYNAN